MQQKKEQPAHMDDKQSRIRRSQRQLGKAMALARRQEYLSRRFANGWTDHDALNSLSRPESSVASDDQSSLSGFPLVEHEDDNVSEQTVKVQNLSTILPPLSTSDLFFHAFSLHSLMAASALSQADSEATTIDGMHPSSFCSDSTVVIEEEEIGDTEPCDVHDQEDVVQNPSHPTIDDVNDSSPQISTQDGISTSSICTVSSGNTEFCKLLASVSTLAQFLFFVGSLLMILAAFADVQQAKNTTPAKRALRRLRGIPASLSSGSLEELRLLLDHQSGDEVYDDDFVLALMEYDVNENIQPGNRRKHEEKPQNLPTATSSVDELSNASFSNTSPVPEIDTPPPASPLLGPETLYPDPPVKQNEVSASSPSISNQQHDRLLFASGAYVCFACVGLLEWIQFDLLRQLWFAFGGLTGFIGILCNESTSQIVLSFAAHCFLIAAAFAVRGHPQHQKLLSSTTSRRNNRGGYHRESHSSRVCKQTSNFLTVADWLFLIGAVVKVTASYCALTYNVGAATTLAIHRTEASAAAFWIASATLNLACLVCVSKETPQIGNARNQP